jgi:CheY-like chemotaxis protein
MLLQRVLRQTHLPLERLFEAGDGCAALEILKKEIVSISMPKMDGLQLLAQLYRSRAMKSRQPPTWICLPLAGFNLRRAPPALSMSPK